MNELEVYMNGLKVKNSQSMAWDKTQPKPKVIIPPDGMHSILMVDPDAPSRSNPKYKYWLHWMVVNNHDEVVQFEPPTPPAGSGFHRYFIILFKQNGLMDKRLLKPTPERKNFNCGEFVAKHGLTKVAQIHFVTKRE